MIYSNFIDEKFTNDSDWESYFSFLPGFKPQPVQKKYSIKIEETSVQISLKKCQILLSKVIIFVWNLSLE